MGSILLVLVAWFWDLTSLKQFEFIERFLEFKDYFLRPHGKGSKHQQNSKVHRPVAHRITVHTIIAAKVIPNARSIQFNVDDCNLWLLRSATWPMTLALVPLNWGGFWCPWSACFLNSTLVTCLTSCFGDFDEAPGVWPLLLSFLLLPYPADLFSGSRWWSGSIFLWFSMSCLTR